jgi:tetratricopeptide (TPR) repeat protein
MGSDDEIVNKGCEKCPVDNVNWYRAQEFVQKLSAQTGKQYRLPTEAEWEYAARGGNKSSNYSYSGSNSLDAVAWNSVNSGGKTHPVGTKKANELGIFDMTGNVQEWCSDWDSEYTVDTVFDPKGPDKYPRMGQPIRIIRGGDKGSIDKFSRSSYRSAIYPGGLNSGSTGFRVVREIKLEELNALNDTIRKLVRTYIDNKDYVTALEKMKFITATNGTLIPWDYRIMGFCSLQLSDYENALNYYKTGLDKFPNWQSAYDNLRIGYNSIGWDLILKKNFSAALRCFKEGFDKYPSDLFILGNLAHAYLLTGEFQTAKKIYAENKGKNLNDTLSWVSMVNADFKEFQDAGITNDHFQEILDLMNN